ncbi:MAG TPA: TIGR03089 family protein [Blastococcus sp.]|jgi:uncharacterized protein (TIGR03089 family)|nr:TIGR03089 family protein [Blastococcus sp.]
MTPPELFAAVVHRHPSSPLITSYDDATDERVELSGATLANWVAKTANLLQDEFDIGRGSAVAVGLPVHWQTAVVLLGAWSCGATVVDTAVEDEGLVSEVDLVVAAQDRLPALEADGGTAPIVGLSLHPLGLGMSGYLGPARDFALEVRAQGDVFVPFDRPEPETPGLRAGGVELTQAGLVTAAQDLGRRLGLEEGDRLLVDDATAEAAGPVAWLLAPLAAGASIVLCRHPRADRLPERAADERITKTVGVDVPGVPRAGT